MTLIASLWGQSGQGRPRRPIKMVEDGFIWIDAADFDEYGGWTLDTQFLHLMGSPYLIAAGAGSPVEDAAVELDIPQSGLYRVWVRTKDWLPEYSPGRFRLLVNGTPSETVLGEAPTDKWVWRSAGDFRLKEGRLRIALRDLTGYYGRCAAVLLTSDMSYTPPEDLDELIRERSRLKGIPLVPSERMDFDVVVVGGGAAGCCAAIAAARMGAKTALVHGRPVLGGNASDELGVTIEGASAHHPNARETGIIEEASLIAARRGSLLMSEPFRILAGKEGNLTLLINRQVVGVEMEEERTIAAVKAVNTLTGELGLYRGKIFIDCTGDGWVGYYAGAKYRIGREGRDEFGEELAPEKGDGLTMSGCIMNLGYIGFRAVEEDQPVPYTPPPWAAKLPPPEKFGRNVRRLYTGEWWLEHPNDIDDLWDMERARDELIRISFGYWDLIKNRWPERDKAANYRLRDVFISLAKRESRRLMGDYILRQSDLESGRLFPDRISYGGWPIDLHHLRGIFSDGEGPFYCNKKVPIYTIPFRSLYSLNIRNLLFAGRDISATHVALGSVRVQSTLATLGQAVGTAAAMCLRYNCTPRELGRKHIKELQQTLIKHDQYIPGLRNEDPDDLARRANLRASSTDLYHLFDRRRVKPKGEHPLNMPRAVMFPVGDGGRIESIALLLRSDLDEPVEVKLHLREASLPGDFSSRQDLLVVEATLSPRQRGWVEFPLGLEAKTPYLWVYLPKADGVYWHLMEDAPKGSCRAWGGDGGWHVVQGQYYAFSTDPPIRVETGYRVENVVNGITRITPDGPNMWASDPNRPMPQWIELEWDSPVGISEVYLTFDTNLNSRHPVSPVPPECVRDYELAYHDGRGWIGLVQVRGNYQRRRVHRFERVKTNRLRLTVQATNGDLSARVFEIRVY